MTGSNTSWGMYYTYSLIYNDLVLHRSVYVIFTDIGNLNQLPITHPVLGYDCGGRTVSRFRLTSLLYHLSLGFCSLGFCSFGVDEPFNCLDACCTSSQS